MFPFLVSDVIFAWICKSSIKATRLRDALAAMWSNVVFPPEARVPSSRSKHASVLHGQFLYLLGGRNGNVPLKDFWRYCICKFFIIKWPHQLIKINLGQYKNDNMIY